MDDAREVARAERWAMLLPHRDLAVGIVLRVGGNLAEAEDCVHDAMLRLVRRDDLDPARVRSLLVRTALHIAIDHRRAAARGQRATQRLGGGTGAEVVSPEQLQADHEAAQRILAAIDVLPRRERQVILLRLGGLSIVETAARLGISAKSVEGAFTRARARLRLLLVGMLTWIAERLRRAASTHGEVVVTTVAALFLLGPGHPDPGDAATLPPHHAEPPAADSATARFAAPPGATGTSPGPAAPLTPAPPEHPMFVATPGPAQPDLVKHQPPPQYWLGGPIDGPYDTFSWGTYTEGPPPPPFTQTCQYRIHDEGSGTNVDMRAPCMS